MGSQEVVQSAPANGKKLGGLVAAHQQFVFWSHSNLECPASFVPVELIQTGNKGAEYGTREEA
jgi:hypothetical protein